MRNTTKLICSAFLTCAGCTAIFDPPPDYKHITTEPTGAKVVLFPGAEYKSPCDAQFDRRVMETHIEISHPGFVTQRVVIAARGNLWTILDAMPVGLGLVVDVILTGAYLIYTDSPIHFKLTPEN